MPEPGNPAAPQRTPQPWSAHPCPPAAQGSQRRSRRCPGSHAAPAAPPSLRGGDAARTASLRGLRETRRSWMGWRQRCGRAAADSKEEPARPLAARGASDAARLNECNGSSCEEAGHGADMPRHCGARFVERGIAERATVLTFGCAFPTLGPRWGSHLGKQRAQQRNQLHTAAAARRAGGVGQLQGAQLLAPGGLVLGQVYEQGNARAARGQGGRCERVCMVVLCGVLGVCVWR